ncbi:MAG TPA: hypothetical protein VLF66_18955 [Thermoanaerobaculia bacterium]|nr:hypothetical protein [Thermoanaerobaculia bacterium]
MQEVEIQAQVLGELVRKLISHDVPLPPFAAGWLMNQETNPCLCVVLEEKTRRTLESLADFVHREPERVVDLVELERQRRSATA